MSGEGVPGHLRLYAKVPPERIGVLIGEGGRVKEELMRRTRTKIAIDSKTGMIIIEPESPDVPPVNLIKTQDFIRAIGLGFSPERAFRVLDEDQMLVVIDLKQYVGDSPNHLSRIKGRIIGEGGKARRTLEEMTGTYISIYRDNVAIIGDYDQATAAREAVEMLIQGRRHATVYRHLDRIMARVKRKRMIRLWEEPG